MRILETVKVLTALGTTRGLLECETLTSDEICHLLNGHSPVRDAGDAVSPIRGSAVPTAGRGRPHVIGGRMRPQSESDRLGLSLRFCRPCGTADLSPPWRFCLGTSS
jgi:hypothetical protein